MKLNFLIILLAASFTLTADRTLSDHSAHELCKLGKEYRTQGNYQKALSCFRIANIKDPQDKEASLELALAHLACEHFNKGFELLDNHFRTFSTLEKQWHGQDLNGKRLLIHTPSWGYGDLFMFLRFARELKNRGASIVIFADNIIMPFAQIQNYIGETIIINNGMVNDSYFGNIVIFERSKLPVFDYETHLCSLPALMKTTAKTIPQPPYIQAEQERIDYWAKKMSCDPQCKVGLCWNGATRDDAQLMQRSMAFNCLKPLLEKKGCSFYNLQIGDAFRALSKDERDSLIILDEELDKKSGAFMDTAAIIANLDLVITVDTSIAHLAGAMAKPVFVLLPLAAEWRYGMKRCDSLWYPSMRLFRQASPGNWERPIQEVCNALDTLLNADC
ncbi:hypothetical protein HYX58_02345 [Candidatus Dependentiae bacterium]|nr:hypothetical protein [Candidatus Dependentiae bacterium]